MKSKCHIPMHWLLLHFFLFIFKNFEIYVNSSSRNYYSLCIDIANQLTNYYFQMYDFVHLRVFNSSVFVTYNIIILDV